MNHIDTELGISFYFGGGVCARGANIKAGQAVVQHKHKFDHLSILASGTVAVTVDGHTEQITGPACLTIAAGKHHGVKALTDAVWFCLHATDITDPVELDEVLIEPSDQAEMQTMADNL